MNLTPTNLETTYQSRWRSNLPPQSPSLIISDRNWNFFVRHVNGESMCQIGREHGLTRARMSAIMSRVDQLLRMELAKHQITPVVQPRLQPVPVAA